MSDLFTSSYWPPPGPGPDNPATNGHAPPQGGPTAPPGSAQAYALAALDAELAILGSATEGERNETLNTATFNVAQLVAAGHLDRSAYDLIRHTALGTGLPEHEVDKTMRSAIEAGEAKPRHVDEGYTGQEYPEATVFEPDPPERDDLPYVDWHEAYAAKVEEDWLVWPLLSARRLVALFSPAKVGKSLLMLELAVAISRGTDALGTHQDRPRRVLYVDFENDITGDVVPRLKDMGYGPEDLEELRYLSFPTLPYLDTAMGGWRLVAKCDEDAIEVVVIDTISRAVQGEENENDTWLAFYRHTGLELKKRGIACVRLDHTGKDITKGMRGGSAKYSDVDAAWQLTPFTDELLRLECVANRLPISTKQLMIERRSDPLHHLISTKRTGDVLHDQEQELMDQLDRLLVPRSAGRPQCEAALREAAIPWKTERLAAAIRTRKQGVHEATVIDLPVPGLGTAGEDPS